MNVNQARFSSVQSTLTRNRLMACSNDNLYKLRADANRKILTGSVQGVLLSFIHCEADSLSLAGLLAPSNGQAVVNCEKGFVASCHWPSD